MKTRAMKIFSIIIVLIFQINISFSQNKIKFKEFVYDQIFQYIKFIATDESEYTIKKIIIAEDKFIKSKYEQNSVKSLYSDTQDYFTSLIGKNFFIEKKKPNLEDFLFKLDDGKILPFDLVRKGLAVNADVPKNELKKNEEVGFDLNNKKSLTNYIFLLSESKNRLDEVNNLIDLYQKKFQKDYIWCLLKAKILNLESEFDSERSFVHKIADLYKEALKLNPQLIDLNKHIAFCYSKFFEQMVKKEKPRDYLFINEFIKYIQKYLDLEEENISKLIPYFHLANAFYLKDDFNNSFKYLMKYLEEEKEIREYKTNEEKLGISFEWETYLFRASGVNKHDLDNILILSKEMPLSSKLRIYNKINNLIKSGQVEYYNPTEQDEINTREIEKEYYLAKIEKTKIIKSRNVNLLYAFLALFSLNFSILIFLEIKKKRKVYLYILGGIILIFIISSLIYAQNLQQKEKIYSKDINRINSEINLFQKKEIEKKEKEEKAINLAKAHATWINRVMKEKKGEIKIRGWKATEEEDDIYFVKYTYYDGEKKTDIGWFFEVQLKEGLVRSILGDKGLEKKYKF